MCDQKKPTTELSNIILKGVFVPPTHEQIGEYRCPRDGELILFDGSLKECDGHVNHYFTFRKTYVPQPLTFSAGHYLVKGDVTGAWYVSDRHHVSSAANFQVINQKLFPDFKPPPYSPYQIPLQ